MKFTDYIRGFFGRTAPASEPMLALPPPVMTERQYLAAEVAECKARLNAVYDGGIRSEIENAEFCLEVAKLDLEAHDQEVAEEWRGRGYVN